MSFQLEKFNQELTTLLAKHTKANDQLQAQMQWLTSQSQHLQKELNDERQNFRDKQKRILKEQFQVCISHQGIVVSKEKKKTLIQNQPSAKK